MISRQRAGDEARPHPQADAQKAARRQHHRAVPTRDRDAPFARRRRSVDIASRELRVRDVRRRHGSGMALVEEHDQQRDTQRRTQIDELRASSPRNQPRSRSNCGNVALARYHASDAQTWVLTRVAGIARRATGRIASAPRNQRCGNQTHTSRVTRYGQSKPGATLEIDRLAANDRPRRAAAPYYPVVVLHDADAAVAADGPALARSVRRADDAATDEPLRNGAIQRAGDLRGQARRQ